MEKPLAGFVLVLFALLCCASARASADTAQRVAGLLALADRHEAKSELFAIVAENPEDADAWLGMARVCAKLDELDEAIAAYKRVDVLGRLGADERAEYGDVLKRAGRLEEAYAQLKLALAGGASEADGAPGKAGQPGPSLAAAIHDELEQHGAREASKPGTAEVEPKPDSAVAAARPNAAEKESNGGKRGAAPSLRPAGGADENPASWREVTPDTDGAEQGAAGPGTAQVAQVITPSEPGRVARQPEPNVVQVVHEAPAKPVNIDVPVKSGEAQAKQNEAAPPEAPPADPLEAARYYVGKQQWADAVKSFEQYMQQGPVSDGIRLEYADALRESGDLAKAEDEYNRLLHANPDNLDAKLGLAKVLAKHQKITEAMYLLDQVFVSEKTYAKVQLTRAYVYFVNDYVGEAITMIGEVLGHEPDNAEANRLLKEYTKVQDEQQGWNKPGPLPEDVGLRAEILYNRGERAEAKRDFEQVVRADPSNIMAWQRLANLYRWDEQWQDAADAYLKYLRLRPDDYEAKLQYAQVLLSMGDCQDAADELWALISAPSTPIETYNDALVAYATALSACGNGKEALSWYEQALRFDPHNAGLRTAYAGALAGLRHFDQARIQYEIVLDDDPGNQAAKLGLAQSYAWAGEQKKAQKYYDQIDASGDYYAASRIGKAYSYLWDGQRGKALALAEEASRLAPGNPDLPALYTRLNERPDNLLVTAYSRRHDSEGNDYRGVVGTLSVPLDARGTALNVQHEDLRLDNNNTGLVSDGSNTKLSISVPLGSRATVSGSASFLDMGHNDVKGWSKWNWSASARFDLRDWWQARLSYADQTFYDTPQLTRNQISVQEWTLATDWRLRGGTLLTGQYAHGELSDNNSRESWAWRLGRHAQREGLGRFDYGVTRRTLDYSHDANNGYWDPDNYVIYEAFTDFTDTSARRFKLDGGLGWGIQRDSHQGWSDAFRYSVGLRYGWRDGRYVLRTGYSSSDAYDTATAGRGYRSRTWYLNGDFQF